MYVIDMKLFFKRPTEHFVPHDSCYFVRRVCNLCFSLIEINLCIARNC